MRSRTQGSKIRHKTKPRPPSKTARIRYPPKNPIQKQQDKRECSVNNFAVSFAHAVANDSTGKCGEKEGWPPAGGTEPEIRER